MKEEWKSWVKKTLAKKLNKVERKIWNIEAKIKDLNEKWKRKKLNWTKKKKFKNQKNYDSQNWMMSDKQNGQLRNNKKNIFRY